MKCGTGTIWKKTSKVVLIRLPRKVVDDEDFDYEHGDKVRVTLLRKGDGMLIDKLGKQSKK